MFGHGVVKVCVVRMSLLVVRESADPLPLVLAGGPAWDATGCGPSAGPGAGPSAGPGG